MCMKFEVTSFNTFEVIPRTIFHDARPGGQMDGPTDRVTPVYLPNLHLWGYKNAERALYLPSNDARMGPSTGSEIRAQLS